MKLHKAQIKINNIKAEALRQIKEVWSDKSLIGLDADESLVIRTGSELGKLSDHSQKKALKLIDDLDWALTDLVNGRYVVVNDAIQPSEELGAEAAKGKWDKKSRTWGESQYTVRENYERIFGS